MVVVVVGSRPKEPIEKQERRMSASALAGSEGLHCDDANVPHRVVVDGSNPRTILWLD
jgi:hypothetical protein